MSKRARRKPSVARTWANEGRITPEYARKIGDDAEAVEKADGTASSVTVLQILAPIDRLHRDGKITQSEYDAGCKYRSDYQRSGLDTLRAADYTREVVDGGEHKPEPGFRIDALDAYHKATAKLPYGIGKFVFDVVVLEVPVHKADAFLVTADAAHQSTFQRGLLRQGLQILAAHYGMKEDWR